AASPRKTSAAGSNTATSSNSAAPHPPKKPPAKAWNAPSASSSSPADAPKSSFPQIHPSRIQTPKHRPLRLRPLRKPHHPQIPKPSKISKTPKKSKSPQIPEKSKTLQTMTLQNH